MMQRIENAKPCLPRCVHDLQHVRNTVIGFGYALNTIPYLAAFGNEIVVGIDYEKCGGLFVILHTRYVASLYAFISVEVRIVECEHPQTVRLLEPSD
jgi:hypothetical protein